MYNKKGPTSAPTLARPTTQLRTAQTLAAGVQPVNVRAVALELAEAIEARWEALEDRLFSRVSERPPPPMATEAEAALVVAGLYLGAVELAEPDSRAREALWKLILGAADDAADRHWGLALRAMRTLRRERKPVTLASVVGAAWASGSAFAPSLGREIDELDRLVPLRAPRELAADARAVALAGRLRRARHWVTVAESRCSSPAGATADELEHLATEAEAALVAALAALRSEGPCSASGGVQAPSPPGRACEAKGEPLAAQGWADEGEGP